MKKSKVMFKDNATLGVILAVIVLITFVLIAVKMTSTLIDNDKINFIGVFIIVVLVSIWTIDNVIAFKTQLLEPDENKMIMQVMSNVVFYVLGRQQGKKESGIKK